MKRTLAGVAAVTTLLVGPGCATQPSSAGSASGAEASTEEQPPTSSSDSADRLDYPESNRKDVVETLHGEKVRDPYRWLEPSDDPEVREWSREQNGLARGYLDDLPLREKLRERFRELYYVESVSAPQRRGGRMFYARQHPEKQKEVYYWRPADAPPSEERVLLDPNRMSEERDANLSLGEVSPSWDGKKVAYTLQKNNADRATLYVMEVDSGEVRDADVLEGARWASPSWTPDSEGFFYTRYPTDPSVPKDQRPGEADVRYHRLGTEASEDWVVRQPTHDPRTFQGVEISRDGNYLVRFVSHGWTRTDIYFARPGGFASAESSSEWWNQSRVRSAMDERTGPKVWKPLAKGKNAKFRVRIHEGYFYIRTNDGAPKYRLFRVPTDAPDRSNWKEIVSERDDAVLDGFRIVGGRLVLSYLKDAHSELETRKLDGTDAKPVGVPKLGTAYRVSGQPEHETAYVTYESFKSPKQIYETTVATGEAELWSKTEVPADLSQIRVRQVWYESKDGTDVSMFLLHRKGLERDGSTPFLMTGYGGFDVSYTPFFLEHVVPWLEAGGGFALPNLRGGGEYGEKWHRAGMLEKKQNTFDDFVAAAEYLTDEGYTSPDRLAIRGASNGGLLVGAVTTQRPDLFRAVVCSVPLLDMVRYTKFGPAKTWIHEYGDPEKSEHFEFLYDYSPYHNVEKGTDYPAVLMLSAASDDRVHPMHARKMTAALQWASSSEHPILFRLQKKAGHGGADMIKKRVAEETDTYAFLFHELGLEW